MVPTLTSGADAQVWKSRFGIPVRNLWVLLVYAAGLAEFQECRDVAIDDSAALPDIVGKLLAVVVERRLRRNLSRGFRQTSAILPRVRGRIDWLQTISGQYLERGRVGCRFEELTQDTTRNRLVRSALEAMRSAVTDRALSNTCGQLARHLEASGVSAQRLTRAELSRDQIARHDSDDRLMVAVAKLALDRLLPSEAEGATRLSSLDRDEVRLRRIFEDAVAGFYKHELHGRRGWRVHRQPTLLWQQADPSQGIHALLPTMSADVILDQGTARRIVIDTKFTGIVTTGRYENERLKSGYLYQLYAYLRSQEGLGALADGASGILLHPSLDRAVDERVTLQGHEMRFATVDLTAPVDGIRQRLLGLVEGP